MTEIRTPYWPNEGARVAPAYLGDGAYVALTEQGIELTTSNGLVETNRIVLGENELAALLLWVREQFPTVVEHLARQPREEEEP
jgi:hypothetical protein